MARKIKKQTLGRSLSALLKETTEIENRYKKTTIDNNSETISIEFTLNELKGFASVMDKIKKASK